MKKVVDVDRKDPMIRDELIKLFAAVDRPFMDRVRAIAVSELAAMQAVTKPSTISMPTHLAQKLQE